MFLPKSALNEIRRCGLEAFEKQILSEHLRCEVARCSICDHECTEPEPTGEDTRESEVNVSVITKEQLLTALESRADLITVPMHLFERVCDRQGFDPGAKKILIALPYIIREEAESTGRKQIADLVCKIKNRGYVAGFVASNHESVSILKDLGYDGIIAGDVHMYAYNTQAYDFYRDNGIDIMTVPVELNIHELRSRDIRGEELIIYGRIPVMISANCIRKTKSRCNSSSAGNTLYITDRKGEKLFVVCDCASCTNTIYNSAVLSISDETDLIDIIRPSSVRLSFTDERAEEMKRILDRYFANRMPNGSTSCKLIDRYTKGHIRRGVD